MKYVSFAGCAAVALALGSSAMAAPQVDQSQYSLNLGIPFAFPSGGSDLPVGQSFTAGLSGLLTDITVASDGQIESGGSLTLEVLSGNGTGGTLLGSITETYGVNSYDPALNWFGLDVDVSSLGIDVTDGSQYTFLFTDVTGTDFPGRGIDATYYSSYSGGNAIAAGYGSFASGWDLTFDTEVDTSPSTSTVPDGGMTVVLLGGVLLGLVALRRTVAKH